MEIAVNVPFEASEIIEIACQEFRKRLEGLSPLHGNKEYGRFSIDFNHTLRLWRAGDVEAKETTAWGLATGRAPGNFDIGELVAGAGEFQSGDPNEERMARDMPMTVESKDGKGGKVRRKVRIKG